MTILIKGEAIDKLVETYCALIGVDNKSEAVRQALADQIRALQNRETLSEKIAKVQQEAASLGLGPRETVEDDKVFMDDLWDDA